MSKSSCSEYTPVRIAGTLCLYVLLWLSWLFAYPVAYPAVAGAGAGLGAREEMTSERTFGSQAVLAALWTADELKGTGKDGSMPHQIRPAKESLPIFSGGPPAPALHEFQGSIRSVKLPEGRKEVALTFDLCERVNVGSGYDAEVVNYLRDNDIKATFFAGGKWMRSHPEAAMQLIADPLFEVGNHSWTHENFRLLDRNRMMEQVLWTQAQYEILRDEIQKRAYTKQIDPSEMERIPNFPMVFRFPYGTCNTEALNLLRELGLLAIQWNVVSGDAATGQTPQAIARIILQQAKPGSIIICHANGRGYGTGKALSLFIPKLRDSDFKFVTVSELLARGDMVSTDECYENRPGDNLRYDFKFRAKHK